ncbi:MAG: hypothetical protein R3B48_10915 [Kofleriaceae bacterium]
MSARASSRCWSPAALAVLFLTALAVGCGGPPAVSLNNEWPQQPGSYHSVTREWTRSASLQASYQQILSVDATLLSPQWRAAHATRDAELRGLGPAAQEALLASARERAAGPWEVELLVTTWDRRENNLHRGARATWKVALLDEQGNEISPTEVVRDRRPAHVVQAEFPTLGDFAEAYVARFPKEHPVLGPGTRRVRLRLTSARGAVELEWRAP